MFKRLGTALAVMAAVAQAGPVPVDAHPEPIVSADGGYHASDDQHGGEHGHLPATSENVEVVGRMHVNQDQTGRVADVEIFGNYAYLGAYYEPHCQKGGVYVFDISDLAAPKQINFIRNGNNTYVSEGVQVVHLDTAAFTGDVLIHNNEVCDKTKRSTAGGVGLVDVTNPKTHKYLANNVGDFGPASFAGGNAAHSVHSAFAWQAGDRAYAILVDNEEEADVDIVDITNPRAPVLIAEYDVEARWPQTVDPTLGTSETWLHDVTVELIEGRWVASLSYWDTGYVLVDVTDPTNPTYIADSDYENPDPLAAERGFTVRPEGNAHQSEFTRDKQYLIATDEDFDAYTARGFNLSEGGTFEMDQGDDVPLIDADTTVEGDTVFAGRACPGNAAVPAGDGSQIAVVARGGCTFTEKMAAVEQAGGYVGAIFYNREGGDGCNSAFGMRISGGIPAVSVPRDIGFSLFDAGYDETACRAATADAGAFPAAVGAVGDRVRLAAQFDGWGYVHLFRVGPGKLDGIDTYAIPEAHDPGLATGAGDLSVHEVATSHVDDRLAYLSYYSGGFRVIRVSEAGITEVGRFIDQGGSNFWGVEVFSRDGVEYVAASDRDHGIYIFRYTGP